MLAEVNWTAILGAGSLGVVVSAITGYVLAARKMSGQIETSDADQLWAEASSIRTDYRAQLAQLRIELADCKKTGETLRRRITVLEAKLKGVT